MFRIENFGRNDSIRSRLHQSEPVLCLSTQPSVPRLHRLQSLPVHDDSNSASCQVPNPSVKVGGWSVVKAPIRRKLSLCNLFAKPGFKGKVSRPRDTASSNTLLPIPNDAEPIGFSPLVRVRSRSTPFCEMSPIQENFGESVSDSLESCSGNKIQLPIFIDPPEESIVEFKYGQEGPIHEMFRLSTSEEPAMECFVGTSDDSSSDSDLPQNPTFPRSIGREPSTKQSLSSLRSVDSLSSNVALNATTHPSPLPELQPIYPCPTRSPRCSAVSPVEVSKPLVSTITAPVVVHGTTPSRPSPCPRRSSESEINITPKGKCVTKFNTE